jgi:glycosyltransferase involved in cell wall biosynthesis
MTAPVLMKQKIDVSIVIPLYNEEENLELLFKGLKDALASLGRTCEIIFVDDGSRDGTYNILKKIAASDPRVWVVRFRRNFGQTAAFSAGFHLAHGDVVVTMDGDLQNDPRDIATLLQKVDEGFDVVSGWRVNRQDKFITRKIPSRIANALISRVTGVKLHDYGCSLKAYRRDVVKNIHLYGEMHRFIPALASWVGTQVAEVPVNHHARRFGKSKYGLGRTVRVVLDLITVKFLLDYATRPLQIFGLWGIFSLGSGMALGIYLSIIRLFFGQPLSNRPIILLVVLLIMLGVQLIIMGLLGELIVRTYHEAQGKPIYMIREVLEPEAYVTRRVVES